MDGADVLPKACGPKGRRNKRAERVMGSQHGGRLVCRSTAPCKVTGRCASLGGRGRTRQSCASGEGAHEVDCVDARHRARDVEGCQRRRVPLGNKRRGPVAHSPLLIGCGKHAGPRLDQRRLSEGLKRPILRAQGTDRVWGR